jgi:hypothetical protein
MPVQRCMGSASEVEVYRGLGRLAQLTTIFLTLDCTDTSAMRPPNSPIDISDDEFMQQWYDTGSPNPSIRNGCVRDALLNSTVDQALVRFIWDCISTSRIGKPLLSLKICTLGAELQWESTPFTEVIQHISRSFLLQRSVRDDDDSVDVA